MPLYDVPTEPLTATYDDDNCFHVYQLRRYPLLSVHVNSLRCQSLQEGMAAQTDAEASSAPPEVVSPAPASASCDTDAQVAAEPASSAGAAGYASLDSGSASQFCSSQEASGTATTSQQVGNVSLFSQKLPTILNSQPSQGSKIACRHSVCSVAAGQAQSRACLQDWVLHGPLHAEV